MLDLVEKRGTEHSSVTSIAAPFSFGSTVQIRIMLCCAA